MCELFIKPVISKANEIFTIHYLSLIILKQFANFIKPVISKANEIFTFLYLSLIILFLHKLYRLLDRIKTIKLLEVKRN